MSQVRILPTTLSLWEIYLFTFYIMWLFSGIFQVAKLPVSVALDVVTLGWVAADRRKSFTRQNCEDADDAFNR